MKRNNKLSEVWLKASVLGATWAASEIILGSFLHNLHVPFKGNVLTAIGIILLIAASYRWKDRGLFWRSGLICAMMKAMSPSAVIFGPMVAIFMEAVLFEMSVRALGRNILGFITGAALAMSWVLFQKLANLLIYYGSNIVEIYSGVLRFVEKQLNISTQLFWQPLLLLLCLYLLFGIITALIGIKIGKEITASGNEVKDIKFIEEATELPERFKGRQVSFDHSIAWLIGSFVGLIGLLTLIGVSEVYLWFPVSVLAISIWVVRYKKAMHQLSRPRFWISFGVISLLAAITITYISGEKDALVTGLLTGLEMNARAAVVIIGFSALGTELYNPRIRNFLQNSSYRNISGALELAFETLPSVFSHLPDARTFFTKPAGVVKLLLSLADKRYAELNMGVQPFVIILSGEVAEGKTTLLSNLAIQLKKENISAIGFLAPRILLDGQTIGYDLTSIETGETVEFMRLSSLPLKQPDSRSLNMTGATADQESTGGRHGKFLINKMSLDWGKRILSTDNIRDKQVVMIDEIGRFELHGEAWSESIESLLQIPDLCLIITVRSNLIPDVISKFGLYRYLQYPIVDSSIHDILKQVMLFTSFSTD